VHFEDVQFLSVSTVEHAHDVGLKIGGGAAGVRDQGLLESAVMAPQSGYYRSLAELAAVYAHGIAKNHAFIDGKKRTAFIAASMFLEGNGFAVALPKREWLAIMEGVADGSVSRDQLTAHFTEAMGGDAVELEG
jgi:death on curing protein